MTTLANKMAASERSWIRDALRESGGNVAAAAKALDVPLSKLVLLLVQHDIEPDKYAGDWGQR